MDDATLPFVTTQWAKTAFLLFHVPCIAHQFEREVIVPIVFIPPSFRSLSGGQETVDVEGTNVREVIDNLNARFSGIRERLTDGDRLRADLSVVIGTRVGRLGLLEKVPPQSEVHFIPTISGG